MRAGLNADRLVTAGAELADAEGLEAVTVSALARHFDVRPASVYSHLAGSDDLRARIALLALAETADRAADALAGRSGRDALVALADVYRDYAREHPGATPPPGSPSTPRRPGPAPGHDTRRWHAPCSSATTCRSRTRRTPYDSWAA